MTSRYKWLQKLKFGTSESQILDSAALYQHFLAKQALFHFTFKFLAKQPFSYKSSNLHISALQTPSLTSKFKFESILLENPLEVLQEEACHVYVRDQDYD